MADEVSELLQQAMAASDALQFQEAGQFFERALNVAPNDPQVLLEYAQLLVAVGDSDRARQLLFRALQADPGGDATAYLMLGQLLEGEDALKMVRQGVSMMQAQSYPPKMVSDALCTCAELWMTDLCMEPQAEKECEQAVMAAVQADPGNADAYNVLASFRISQQRPEEALVALRKGFALWGEVDEEAEEMDDDEFENMVSFGTRLTAAKLFVELQEYEPVRDIIENLIIEQEDDPELYLVLATSLDPVNEVEARMEALRLAQLKVDKLRNEGEQGLEHMEAAIAASMPVKK